MTRIAIALVLLGVQDGTIDSAVRSIPGLKEEPPLVGDADFLRRVSRDLLDVPPTNEEIQAFAANPDPGKRAKKVDEFLADQRFAAFWARRLTRVYFGDPDKVRMDCVPGLAADAPAKRVKDFTAWLQKMLHEDRPYTEIVRRMLEARGSTRDLPEAAYLPSLMNLGDYFQAFSEGVSRHFLGIRLACARCHDHPYDKWRLDDYYGLAAFGVRLRLRADGVDHVEVKMSDEGELVMPSIEGGVKKTVNLADAGTAPPIFFFGGKAEKNDDRMKVLSQFMTAKNNTQLPRALANRVWSWLVGRGVVHPVDDFNLRNKARSAALIQVLSDALTKNTCSVKHLVRAICNSETYQRVPVAPFATEGERLWAGKEGSAFAPRPIVSKPPTLPLAVEPPARWIRVNPTMGGAAQFVVPDKEKKAPDAHMNVFATGKTGVKREMDSWVARMVLVGKPQKVAFEGKIKGMVTEIAGRFCCDPVRDGLTDDLLLVAELPVEDKVYLLRLLGPAEVVNGWREEFMTMVKGASK